MNGDNTKYHVSDGHPLTTAEIARLDAIEARLGNTVAIPETSDAAWATAVRGKPCTSARMKSPGLGQAGKSYLWTHR